MKANRDTVVFGEDAAEVAPDNPPVGLKKDKSNFDVETPRATSSTPAIIER